MRAPDGWDAPRFPAVCMAGGWFRQKGVLSSHPPAGNACRWVARGFLNVGPQAYSSSWKNNVLSAVPAISALAYLVLLSGGMFSSSIDYIFLISKLSRFLYLSRFAR